MDRGWITLEKPKRKGKDPGGGKETGAGMGRRKKRSR
jgi:hypothetical protein